MGAGEPWEGCKLEGSAQTCGRGDRNEMAEWLRAAGSSALTLRFVLERCQGIHFRGSDSGTLSQRTAKQHVQRPGGVT